MYLWHRTGKRAGIVYVSSTGLVILQLMITFLEVCYAIKTDGKEILEKMRFYHFGCDEVDLRLISGDLHGKRT